MQIDLHGYRPREIINTGVLREIVRQAWEMGEGFLTLVHGHGRNRGISPGFVNTNTGYFGLRIREALRRDESLLERALRTALKGPVVFSAKGGSGAPPRRPLKAREAPQASAFS
jgi:hypothetical protein